MNPTDGSNRIRSILLSNSSAKELRERLLEAGAALDRRALFTLDDELQKAQSWRARCALFWFASDNTDDANARAVFTLHAGISAYDAGDLELARDLLRPLIHQSTEAHHHCIYARVLLELGELDAAMDAANRTVELDPDFEEGWFRVGEVCRVRRDWDDAIAAFDRARRLDPSAELYAVEYAGAVIAVEIGGVRHPAFEMAESLLAPIAARGDNFMALIYWAQAQWLLDHPRESEHALRTAMRVDPEAVLPYTLLAMYLADWGRPSVELDALVEQMRARADDFAHRDPIVAEHFRNAVIRVQDRRGGGSNPPRA